MSDDENDRVFRVRLDLERIRRNLSAADVSVYDEQDVREWLRAAGFSDEGAGWWLVRERDLGQVEPEEVVAASTSARPPLKSIRDKLSGE